MGSEVLYSLSVVKLMSTTLVLMQVGVPSSTRYWNQVMLQLKQIIPATYLEDRLSFAEGCLFALVDPLNPKP